MNAFTDLHWWQFIKRYRRKRMLGADLADFDDEVNEVLPPQDI